MQDTTYGLMTIEEAIKGSLEILKKFDAENEDRYKWGIGELAYLQLGDLTNKIPVRILKVHLDNNKCEFDLQLAIYGAAGWHTTTIKNVSSDYVFREKID